MKSASENPLFNPQESGSITRHLNPVAAQGERIAGVRSAIGRLGPEVVKLIPTLAIGAIMIVTLWKAFGLLVHPGGRR